MTLRPGADEDRDAVVALAVAEEAAWFGEAETSAEEIGEWIGEEGGVARGVVAVDGAGRVAGFASPGEQEALLMADPADAAAPLGELLEWLLAQPGVAELTVFAEDAARVAAVERRGLRHGRSSFSLARAADAGPLPEAAFPEGVEVAPYRLGDDDEAVHRLIYVDAAWASVPGHHERDLDAWRTATRTDGTLFLARRAGRPVGWVAGHLLESGRGYVGWLAVAAAERGGGLGRALLLHAFAELRQRGARGLTLDVQAENASALGLYRSVGLEVEREWRSYVP
jgi:mycothiol synthase